MVAWEVKQFGGMIPRVNSRLLADNSAEELINVDLVSGQLMGLPQPVLTYDFTSHPGPVERAYLLPGPNYEDPIWVPFPSRYSSIVRSPLANDDTNRIYWTNPDDDLGPWFTTYADVVAGNPPHALGVPQPTAALVISSATGGTTTVPQITRLYVYTWVNSFGEETAPSPASNSLDGPPDATWNLSAIPTTPPVNPTGRPYAPVTQLVLYRTITGDQTGAQFHEVIRWNYPGSVPATFADTIPDTLVANKRLLESIGWGNPPDGLDGLVALTSGMLAGFTHNTVHFCEPDRPHTWPSVYDQSVHYGIVALAAWQNFLTVLTSGFPSTGSGSSPSNFQFAQSRSPDPCIARGSVVTDLQAVYYASQNGLIQASGYGMQNQTLPLVDKEMWINVYKARDLIACRHRTQYMAINGTDKAFTIDYGLVPGFCDLNTFKDVVCIWNDEVWGDTFLCADKKIYMWDSPTAKHLPYRWRSKKFFSPMPISLGAVQITCSHTVENPQDPDQINPPLDNGDTSLDLPPGVNAVFNYYAGPDFALIMSHNITNQQELFRLPKGFRAFDHQLEIISLSNIYSVQVATTYAELRGV
jgi:hypothetical protein